MRGGGAGPAGGEGRAYRLLLRLLPAAFRREHAAAMAETFAALRESARRRGWWSVWSLYVREAWDLTRVGISLRGGAAGSRRSRKAFSVRHLADGRGRGSGLREDARFAFRSATRHPGSFVLAALTLALGIGATTAIYSALKTVVLDPLPFPHAERLVLPWRTMGASMLTPTPAQVAALEAETKVFELTAMYGGGEVTLSGAGQQPVLLQAVRMDTALPRLMGVEPVLGRLFAPDELAGAGERVALLSYGLWRGAFGGDRGVIGRAVTLDGEPWTVIGVMPADAVRPNGEPSPVDLWLPLTEDAEYRQMVARLGPGVSMEAASERVDALFREADANAVAGGTLTSARLFRAGGLDDPLRVLMLAVSLLLLIACVNVSNLLLQRAASRQRETAVRAALGAGRLRLIRQFMAESLLLALTGCALGIGIAAGSLSLVRSIRPTDLSALRTVGLDGNVLLFSVGVSLVAGLLFGVLPAIQGARPAATNPLAGSARQDGGASSARFRWSLVGVELALSFALLVGATLLVGTLRDHAARDSGYSPELVVDVGVTLPAWRYEHPAARTAAFDRMAARIGRIAGIDRVALADGVPPAVGVWFGRLQVDGQAPQQEATIFHGAAVDGEFPATIGQPLLSGRAFTAADRTADAHPVILGESAARRLFPEGDAVGRRFSFGDADHTVIGVVGDIAIVGLGSKTDRPIAYRPIRTVNSRMHLVVRTAREDDALAAELRSAVRAEEAEALVEIARGDDLLGASLARERFTTALLAAFAAIALLLSGVGLYGVVAQIVTARTYEIGVRVSLGADARRIRVLVLRTGLVATAAGLAGGAVLAAVGLRLLGSTMFGLDRPSPGAYAVAAALLGAIALLAMWRPAERAARTDPARAIRAE